MTTPDEHSQPSRLSGVVVSKLPEGAQRFLARAVDHALLCGVRSPTDFLRYFPPSALMAGLSDYPARRAHILEKTIGLKARIGLRKSPESSAEDLQIALDEHETDASTVVSLLEPDDRVRFLEAKRLWSFVADAGLAARTHPTSAESVQRLHQHTAFAIEAAIEERLLAAEDVVGAVSVQTIVQHLPRDEVASIIERAIAEGKRGEPLTEAKLLDAVSVRNLCEHIPIATVWEWVLGAKVAAPAGWASEEIEPLFEESEAHPDASDPQEVTVIVDPHETQPSAAAKSRR